MKYTTINEFSNFIYDKAQIAELEVTPGGFHLWLDNVGILPENSCNRDIRRMRCNGMLLRITNPRLTSFVEEGYRYYDANGRLMREDEDRQLELLEYEEHYKVFAEGYVVSLERRQEEERLIYTLVADGNDEHTYCLTIEGSSDVEEWDRFLSPDDGGF